MSRRELLPRQTRSQRAEQEQAQYQSPEEDDASPADGSQVIAQAGDNASFFQPQNMSWQMPPDGSAWGGLPSGYGSLPSALQHLQMQPTNLPGQQAYPTGYENQQQQMSSFDENLFQPNTYFSSGQGKLQMPC